MIVSINGNDSQMTIKRFVDTMPARDSRYLGLACRIAAEIGSRIVKTYYCEDFYKVVESCPVPIVMAGRKKIPEKDALEMTSNAIKEVKNLITATL